MLRHRVALGCAHLGWSFDEWISLLILPEVKCRVISTAQLRTACTLWLQLFVFGSNATKPSARKLFHWKQIQAHSTDSVGNYRMHEGKYDNREISP